MSEAIMPQIDFYLDDVFTWRTNPVGRFDLVYADPPYANCRFKYARQNGSRQWGRSARQDFMRALIARMEEHRLPGGVCALSMATPELRLLHLFPSDHRVMAWVKPYAPHRPHVWPTYAWEPLVVWGKLPGRAEQKASQTPHDWIEMSPKKPQNGGHENPKPDGFGPWVLKVTMGPRMGSVLELFAGTCPVSTAAVQSGRYAVAVDLVDYRSPQNELLVSRLEESCKNSVLPVVIL